MFYSHPFKCMKMIVVRLFIYFLCISIAFCDDGDFDAKVNRFTKLLEEKIQNASTYVHPPDASSFRPTKDDYSTVYGEYDFVIVGAGSAGTVIANRLSKHKHWKVLLLEAGNFADEIMEIPAVGMLNINSEYNWGFNSTPQTQACLAYPNQQCSIPRGKGVGGSTLINGLFYARGNRKDFDFWASQGNPGWSYHDVLPYFKELEKFYKNEPTAVVDEHYHGYNGELSVQFLEPKSIYTNLFLESNIQGGYKNVDYNGRNQGGSSQIQQNTNNGKRCDNGKAFIEPILSRKNFEILPGSYVTKVLINETTKVAYGVQFAHNKTGYTVLVKKEVILSGGTIGSPQILLHSGIGPITHLRDMNIPLITPLDVGSKYLTHVGIPHIHFSTNNTVSGHNITSTVRDYLEGKGRLTNGFTSAAIGFYNLTNEYVENYPNIEIAISQEYPYILTAKEYFETNISNNFFEIILYSTHCYSVGNVRLQSNDPYEFPLIDPNLLSDEDGRDILTVYNGIQLFLSLLDTSAFKAVNASLVKPVAPPCDNLEYLSQKYWYCVIRQLSIDYLHQVGTCAMGPNPDQGAVVDNNLKVHGIKGLRVVDASVIPFTLTCHTSAPTMMVAAKAADIIKREYELFF